jgi:hypothetical protein
MAVSHTTLFPMSLGSNQATAMHATCVKGQGKANQDQRERVQSFSIYSLAD